MKKILLLFILLPCILNAQVGIGTTNPNENSILHIKSNDKGVIFPFVPLLQTSSPSPMMDHVSGMVVYSYMERNDVSPGLYVNDGSKWINLSLQPQTPNLMSYVELQEDLTLTEVTFTDVLELTFVAVKESAAIDFSASGGSATNTSAGIRFQIENINTGDTMGTSTHMQDHYPGGTAIRWNASYSGVLTNLEIGTEYAIVVSASVQKLFGTQTATFNLDLMEDHINLRIIQMDLQN